MFVTFMQMGRVACTTQNATAGEWLLALANTVVQAKLGCRQAAVLHTLQKGLAAEHSVGLPSFVMQMAMRVRCHQVRQCGIDSGSADS